MKNHAEALIFQSRVCAGATNSDIAVENRKFSARASAKNAPAWRIDMNVYGYVRVSSIDQNEDRQVVAMQEAGV